MKRARIFDHLLRNVRVTLTRDAVNPRGMELREIKEYFRPRRTLVARPISLKYASRFILAARIRREKVEKSGVPRPVKLYVAGKEGREREKKKKNVCGARGLHGERGPCTQTILAEHARTRRQEGCEGMRRRKIKGGGCVRARLGQEKVFSRQSDSRYNFGPEET